MMSLSSLTPFAVLNRIAVWPFFVSTALAGTVTVAFPFAAIVTCTVEPVPVHETLYWPAGNLVLPTVVGDVRVTFFELLAASAGTDNEARMMAYPKKRFMYLLFPLSFINPRGTTGITRAYPDLRRDQAHSYFRVGG